MSGSHAARGLPCESDHRELDPILNNPAGRCAIAKLLIWSIATAEAGLRVARGSNHMNKLVEILDELERCAPEEQR